MDIQKKKPIVAITMGDAAGIGPELVCKVIQKQPESPYDVRIMIIGDPDVMRKAAAIVKANLIFTEVSDPDEAIFNWPEIAVLCPEGARVGDFEYGHVDVKLGKAAGICIEKMAKLAKEGKIQGMVSAPLNKDGFHKAGYHYRDEMVLMGEITGSPEPFICGAVNNICTITIAEHVAFKEILGLVKKDRVLSRIRLLNENLKKAGIEHPRLVVAALNPHAGDGGLFGTEEITDINPAIEEAKAEGIDVQGSVAADSVFIGAFAGNFDGVVCMYHDQANIARKLQPRGNGCTLFLGLPVMCGTTAHGTAYDVAGTGVANEGSLAVAVKWASQFAVNQNK